MKTFLTISIALVLCAQVWAGSTTPPPAQTPGLVFREARYTGKFTDDEARFTLELTVESLGNSEVSEPILEGELALTPPKLPAYLRVERSGNQYRLVASKRGVHQVRLEVVARINRADPWNQVAFKGPAAAISAITAQAAREVDLQLLSGTTLQSGTTNGVATVTGFLGLDPSVSLRWSSTGGPAEVTRKAVVTVETSASAQVTPTLARFITQLNYEILQGKPTRLTVSLPASHALTRLAGEQIRDWSVKPGEAGAQTLTVEFLKPLEKSYHLTIYSEQAIDTLPASASLSPPQPVEIERESGALTVSAEDTTAEIESATGLRQVNAPAGSLAAYRFNGRPFALALKLKRIEPVISNTSRVTARLEETRLLVTHTLNLEVEKAGIYGLELTPQPGFAVADVRGDGIDDWKLLEVGKGGARTLHLGFSARVLGARKIEIQLEQPLKSWPDHVEIEPLRVAGAARETAQIGAASAAGIRLKTGELASLREIPISQLNGRTDELLAYAAEQPGWKLSLAAERLTARIVADIFNLVTIGDGIVGGSATIRYGLANQGVQQFEVAVPAGWKNVEFTGPNIRRKEQRDDGVWVVRLQDKAWGGYTLVVTYDFQFDPRGATLPIGGIHAVGAERETGSVALTTAASLKLTAQPATPLLHRVDETELAAADRTLITRSVLLAYQYTGGSYELKVDVKRFEELPVLSAVADRTQLTTVLTEAGEMLTQASFMVKNNDKQFQRFKLPKGATFWSCHVNGQPVKAERDQDWLLAPLPRGANRDRAFSVDIVYAEKKILPSALLPSAFQLQAPQTDVPNTYAEWQLYAPGTLRLSSFGGSMTVARGTTYDLRDSWQKFVAFYDDLIREAGAGLLIGGILIVLMVALVGSAVRRGWNGVLGVLGLFCILSLLAAMMLPALSRAKARAQRISAVNNLKQIGLALKTFALDNADRYPATLEEMGAELGTDKVLVDPESGQRFVYVGGALAESDLDPQSVLAFSPSEINGQRAVLLADGSVQQMNGARFDEITRRGYLVRAGADEAARNRQLAAIQHQQFAGGRVQTFANGGEAAVAAAPAAAPPVQMVINGVAPVAQPAQPAPAAAATTLTTATPATAAGVRSIRIEIPRSGQPFTFTKVLNVRDEPLAIRASIMPLHSFQMVQMTLQLAGFAAGLLLWWWQWRQARRNSFLLALGLMLALGSVGNLLMSWRLLHVGLIWAAPVAVLAFVGWLTWKYWPRKSAAPSPAPPSLGETLPPAVAALAFLLMVSGTQAQTPDPAKASALASQATSVIVPGVNSPAAPAVSLLSAQYVGDVNERVAQMEATLQVSAARAGETLVLFKDDVAVREFSARPAEARLLREGNSIAVRLGRRGETTLRFKLLVKLGGEVTKRQLAFGLPPALTSKLLLTIDQPEADVEFPGAISCKRTTAGQQTRLEAMLGATDRVDLQWTPRVKRAAEIAANVICQNSTLVTFAGGAINLRTFLDYQVTQGEMRQARVLLPSGLRLLRVEGDGIRTWETKAGDAGQLLTVELLKPVAPAYRLTVETEKVLDVLPATPRIEIPHAQEVKRETGVLALRSDDELELTVDRTRELTRVDAEEFTRAAALKDAAGILNAFRFLKTDFELETRVAAQQPQVEAIVRNLVRVASDQVRLSGILDYTIKRAGVFGLKLVLPEDYRVESVQGTNILQWIERREGPARLLEVTLKERLTGKYALRVDLARNFKELAKVLPLAGVHPLGMQKITGYVSVSADAGVALQPATAEGLTEIPAGSVSGLDASDSATALAYKFLASEPQAQAAWTLSVGTEALESWVRAEIASTLTVGETLISGRALARFEIQNAPIKELRLRIPAAFRSVEISGPSIRRRDQDGEIWRVEFQNKVRGLQTLTVTWEEPREAGTNSFALRGISAAGVERETGVLAVVARPPLQVAARTVTDLAAIDTRELPEWAGKPDDATVLAYRYARPGYALAVEALRFAEAEVLQALVEKMNLSTVVADDGQMMTAMSLAVRNNGRQHLEVTLPARSTFWSAFVAGQPVRPSVREGKLLLPLERSVDEEAPVAVELIYIGGAGFPEGRGDLDFVSPQLDVPLKSARWELFLPPDHLYRNFAGTMARETAGTPEAASFSVLDYTLKESESKAELAKELKSELASAKRKLSKGNLKDALAEYNRAKSKVTYSGTRDADEKQLGDDLRKAQGSNLIIAQNEFALNNGSPAPEQLRLPASAAAQVQYDASAAEAQWAKLQQAQDLGAAKVQPIHVNLPTRGLRFAFSQVLQTEIGKPLSIHLTAINDKVISWPKRIAATLAGFAVLWALTALFAQRRQPVTA